MNTQIRKIGNSSGVIIPSHLLQKLHLSAGDNVSITDEQGKVIIEPLEKPKYSLNELIAQCDTSVDIAQDIKEWDEIEPVGLEVS